MNNFNMFNPLQFTHSFYEKYKWNEVVKRFKTEINSFNNKHDYNSIDTSVFFGSEMPNVKALIRAMVVDLISNIYNLGKQSFIFKPTFPIDENPEIQDELNDYSIFLKDKLDDTSSSNFLPALKQHVKDALILGFGITLTHKVNNELQLITFPPEYVEFDVDEKTGIPDTFYIVTPQYRDIIEYENFSFWKVYKKDDGKYVIETWKLKKDLKFNADKVITDKWWQEEGYKKDKRGHIDFKSERVRLKKITPNKGNDVKTFYSTMSSDIVMDFNPIAFTRFNVDSGNVIGLGIGLENLSIIRECKNLYNAYREVACFEVMKPCITTEKNLTEINKAKHQEIDITDTITMPIITIPDNNMETAGLDQRFVPLVRNLNPTYLKELLALANQRIKENLSIDVFVVQKNTEEMTVPEVQVRDELGQLNVDIYTSEIKQSFDHIIRTFFQNYLPEYRKKRDNKELLMDYSNTGVDLNDLSKDKKKVGKSWSRYAFDHTKLSLLFLSKNERQNVMNKISDVTTLVQLQGQIVSVGLQLGIDPTAMSKALNSFSASMGVPFFTYENKTEDVNNLDGLNLRGGDNG